MTGTILIAGLATVAAILLFLFWKLGEETGTSYRFPLQIIVFAFLLGIILLIGKSSIDYKDNCDWLVNSTTVVGNTTGYTHVYTCETNTNSTSNTFYGLTVWIARITAIYLFLVFAFEAIDFFAWRKKGGGQ